MLLLHRHLFLNVLVACSAAIGLFGFVLVLGNALKELLPLVLAGQLAWDTFSLLLALLVPYVAAYALPMGILTGILLVLGRMSAQNEITAMRAAGLSHAYIGRPIFILGVLAALTAAFINFEYMPRARATYKKILSKAVQHNPLSFIVPKTFIRDFPGVVLYVGEKKENVLRDVWMWELDKQNRVIRSGRALSGQVTFDTPENRLVLTLKDVSIEIRNPVQTEDFSKPIQAGMFSEFPIELQLDALFGKQTIRENYSWLTLTELRAKYKALNVDTGATGEGGANLQKERAKLLYSMNEKGSTALAVLAFAVLAIPLGIKVSRKETSANLGVALVMVMTYYFLTVCVGWLDRRPELRPELLLWLPPVGFLVLGGWLFRGLGRV